MQRHDREPRPNDRGFTLVELLIVVVVLGVLATITVFAVRGITDKGSTAAVDSDRQIITTAEESYMAKRGVYATEAQLVSEGLLRSTSSLHDITLAGDSLSYTLVPTSGGGGGGGGGASGTSITFGTVPAVSFGSGPNFIVIGGATALAEWNSLVAANQSTTGNTMIFVNVADIDTTAKAGAVHDASIAFGRVFSTPDDIANFSGGQSLSLYMELSNGLPAQTYAKIYDGSGRNVAWAFAN